LSTIQYNTNFIKVNQHKLTKEEITAKLEGTEKQIKHMMFLLDDVLTYGKSEAGKINLIKSTVNLCDFVEKIIEDVGHSTKNTHTIEFEGIDFPSEIDTDEKLLRNVLINLLTNAIKYSPGRKLVRLLVKEENGGLILGISDTGMGIPPGELDRIFEAFVRGKSVGDIQGTGLGLSIVKKAVELLQGTVRVESHVNEGSTFTVTIPIL
jgi:signal transduction histidine kinase